MSDTVTQERRLLARMAGNIAAGLVTSDWWWDEPDAENPSSKDVADSAVDIAEMIFARLGL